MASEKITALIEEIKTLTILEVVEMVKALEDEFGIEEMSEEDMANIKTVGDLVEYLGKHLDG